MRHLVIDTLTPYNGAALLRVAPQRDELLTVLKASRETLQRANDAPHPFNSVNDTIWHTPHETLFDFMDAAIERAGEKL